MSEDVFYISREEYLRRFRDGTFRIGFEVLPLSRGWKHAFSMAPVARRKRVAAALYRAVTK